MPICACGHSVCWNMILCMHEHLNVAQTGDDLVAILFLLSHSLLSFSFLLADSSILFRIRITSKQNNAERTISTNVWQIVIFLDPHPTFSTPWLESKPPNLLQSPLSFIVLYDILEMATIVWGHFI